MIYADTDFFLALAKKEDLLKQPARELLEKHRGEIWTSPTSLIELLLVASEYGLDPERLIVDVLAMVELRGGPAGPFVEAARAMKQHRSTAMYSLHATFCGNDRIISSDKIYDKFGLDRVPLGRDKKAA